MEFLSSEMFDEKIKTIEARNKEVVSLIEQRRKEFDAEKEIEKKEALVKNVEELEAEFKNNEEEIKKLIEGRDKMKGLEERMSLLNNVTQAAVEARVVDQYDSEEYRNAYANYLKTGDKNIFARAGFTTTTAAPVIPTILQNYIETAWAEFGNIARLCSQVNIKGYYQVPIEKSGSDAVFHAEGAEASEESTITLDSELLKPGVLSDWISITDEVLMLTGSDFLNYVGEHLVYKVFEKLNHGIFHGAGSNGVGLKGIVSSTLTASVSGELGFNIFNEGLAKLSKFKNNKVAMNPETFFKNVLGMTDTTGKPIYQVLTDNTGVSQYFINGMPVEFTEALPTYASALTTGNTAYAVVGDFKGYKLNLPDGKDAEGVQLLVDPYTDAARGKVRNYAKLGAAGAVTKMKRFAKIVTPAV